MSIPILDEKFKDEPASALYTILINLNLLVNGTH